MVTIAAEMVTISSAPIATMVMVMVINVAKTTTVEASGRKAETTVTITAAPVVMTNRAVPKVSHNFILKRTQMSKSI